MKIIQNVTNTKNPDKLKLQIVYNGDELERQNTFLKAISYFKTLGNALGKYLITYKTVSVKDIFSGDTALENIIIRKTAFNNIKIDGILDIPEGISIPPGFISNSSIKELIIHGTVDLGGIFEDANIETLIIKGSIEKIGVNNFSGSKIKELELPPTIRKLSSSAFAGANIRNLIIQNGVTKISARCFWDSDIGQLKLPLTITIIGEDAFNGAIIESLTIQKGVKEIESLCFSGSTIQSLFIVNSELKFPQPAHDKARNKVFFEFSGKVYYFSNYSNEFFETFYKEHEQYKNSQIEINNKNLKVEDLENNFKELAKNDFEKFQTDVADDIVKFLIRGDLYSRHPSNKFMIKLFNYEMLTLYLFSTIKKENIRTNRTRIHEEQKLMKKEDICIPTEEEILQELDNIQKYCDKHAPMTLKLISQGLKEDQMVNLSSTKLKSLNKGVGNYENAEDFFKLCKDMTISDLIEIHTQTPIPPLEKYLKGSIEGVKKRSSFPLELLYEQLTLNDIVRSNKVSLFEQKENNPKNIKSEIEGGASLKSNKR